MERIVEPREARTSSVFFVALRRQEFGAGGDLKQPLVVLE